MDNLKKVDITPVKGKNGLYRITIKRDNEQKSPSVSEISKVLRKPIPKRNLTK